MSHRLASTLLEIKLILRICAKNNMGIALKAKSWFPTARLAFPNHGLISIGGNLLRELIYCA